MKPRRNNPSQGFLEAATSVEDKETSLHRGLLDDDLYPDVADDPYENVLFFEDYTD